MVVGVLTQMPLFRDVPIHVIAFPASWKWHGSHTDNGGLR
jgi:hypothetical protein